MKWNSSHRVHPDVIDFVFFSLIQSFPFNLRSSSFAWIAEVVYFYTQAAKESFQHLYRLITEAIKTLKTTTILQDFCLTKSLRNFFSVFHVSKVIVHAKTSM